jgi:hypothetical protein
LHNNSMSILFMNFSLSKFLKRFLLLCRVMSPMLFNSKGSKLRIILEL